jgi:hypothetical protein
MSTGDEEVRGLLEVPADDVAVGVHPDRDHGVLVERADVRAGDSGEVQRRVDHGRQAGAAHEPHPPRRHAPLGLPGSAEGVGDHALDDTAPVGGTDLEVVDESDGELPDPRGDGVVAGGRRPNGQLLVYI